MLVNPHIKFTLCSPDDQYWQVIEGLFNSQWPGFQFKEHYVDGTSLPCVIIALRQGKVVGGLSYSLFQAPDKSNEVIWVNTVFVVPKWRGQGIASQLLSLSVQQLQNSTQTRLYAYTNIPALYISLGWSYVDLDRSKDHHVMSIAL